MYYGVWGKMPYLSCLPVEEVLKRQYYKDVENRWVQFLRDLKNNNNPSFRKLLNDKQLPTITII